MGAGVARAIAPRPRWVGSQQVVAVLQAQIAAITTIVQPQSIGASEGWLRWWVAIGTEVGFPQPGNALADADRYQRVDKGRGIEGRQGRPDTADKGRVHRHPEQMGPGLAGLTCFPGLDARVDLMEHPGAHGQQHDLAQARDEHQQVEQVQGGVGDRQQTCSAGGAILVIGGHGHLALVLEQGFQGWPCPHAGSKLDQVQADAQVGIECVVIPQVVPVGVVETFFQGTEEGRLVRSG